MCAAAGACSRALFRMTDSVHLCLSVLQACCVSVLNLDSLYGNHEFVCICTVCVCVFSVKSPTNCDNLLSYWRASFFVNEMFTLMFIDHNFSETPVTWNLPIKGAKGYWAEHKWADAYPITSNIEENSCIVLSLTINTPTIDIAADLSHSSNLMCVLYSCL